MKVKHLQQSIFEAKRFIESAETVLRCVSSATYGGKDEVFYSPSHHVAAAKRSSLDLTRTLSILRNGV